MNIKRMSMLLAVVGLLLLIPALAMRVSDEVHWSIADFIVAGVLLLSAGLTIDLALRKVKKPSYRLLLTTFILGSLLLIWTELAVGIFGSPLAGQ